MKKIQLPFNLFYLYIFSTLFGKKSYKKKAEIIRIGMLEIFREWRQGIVLRQKKIYYTLHENFPRFSSHFNSSFCLFFNFSNKRNIIWFSFLQFSIFFVKENQHLACSSTYSYFFTSVLCSMIKMFTGMWNKDFNFY